MAPNNARRNHVESHVVCIEENVVDDTPVEKTADGDIGDMKLGEVSDSRRGSCPTYGKTTPIRQT